MADSVQLRRGAKESLPTLSDGELGWCKNTKELYIGSDRNVKIADAAVFGRVTALETTSGAHTTQISALQDSVSSLDTRATSLESRVTALETGVGSLETTIGTKLTASPAADQNSLPSDADLSTVISAYNGLLAAMRAAGLMNK